MCLCGSFFLASFIQYSPLEGSPEEFDQTIFSILRDRTIGHIERLALNLVKDANRYRYCAINNLVFIAKRSDSFSVLHKFEIINVHVYLFSIFSTHLKFFRKRNYTDTSNFTLRCGVCQTGVAGQKVKPFFLLRH